MELEFEILSDVNNKESKRMQHFFVEIFFCLCLGFAENVLIISTVLICNDSVMGHINVVLLCILNVLIYS